ncbi:hybrid sensor histidine kinase/response regulator [Desulfovibrio inopinatus]|uniref:hybrid sensor histidine kinase/response regulator n=1 Tax=Desulfovibrio inopinatus TaxID=102109 RepID=UPI000422D4A4|nr:response regulator [Desulfovibrio inopinatus]
MERTKKFTKNINRVHKLFPSLGLSKKFLILLLPPVIIVTVIAISALSLFSYYDLRLKQRQFIVQYIERQKDPLIAHIWNYDIPSFTAELRLLLLIPGVNQVTAYDDKGEILAKLNNETAPQKSFTLSVRLNKDTPSRTIFLGTIVVQFSSIEIYGEMLNRFLLAVVFLGILVSIITVSAVKSNRLLVTEPLQRFVSTIRSSRKKEMLQPITWWPANDELGEAIDAYNKLIIQLDARDQKLREREAQLQSTLDELRESELLYRNVSERASDGILIVQDEILVYANMALANMLCCRLEDIIAQPLAKIISPENKDAIVKRYQKRLSGENAPTRYETVAMFQNGPRVNVEVSATVVDYHGKPAGLGIVRDIDARKAVEEALTDAKQKAEEANKAKTKFLASLSHEIRTPMNTIIGMSDMALLSRDEDRESAIQDIRRAADYLMQLFNDLLDLSTIEAAEISVHKEPFNLSEMLHFITDSMQPQANTNKTSLHLHIPDHIPRRVRGDSFRIRQVLLNLLSNAIKFTPQGKVSLTFGMACLYPKQNHQADAACFSIRDTGIGVDTTMQEAIFENFVQGDTSTTREFGGVGLGLAICKHLVEAMQGKIWLFSQKGVGSTFVFMLPLPSVCGESETYAWENASSSLHASCKIPSFNILVVDDSPANTKLMERYCERLKQRMHKAESGPEALDWLTNNTADIVLMDVEMPEMDGYEVTRLIRSGKIGFDQAQIPIIALTAHTSSQFHENCLAAGMNDFLSKPLQFSRFQTLLVSLSTSKYGHKL